MADQEQIDADVAGQKVSIKTNSLNTLATVLTLIMVSVIGYIMFTHSADARDGTKELIGTLKDVVTVQRESNCLASIPNDRKPDGAEFCKRISR